MLRLEITPAGRDRFKVYLDGALLGIFRLPLLDGARALLRLGHDPAALLTIRHRVAAHDSFRPALLGRLAQLTMEEGDKGGLRQRAWKPLDRIAIPGRVPANARRAVWSMADRPERPQ